MAEAQSGTVTLLFTDFQGSTEVLERLGDDEARLLWRAHFRLLRRALSARGGREVKSLGDGLMVAFTSALDAIACAVAVQRSVHAHNQQQDERHRMQVRVGMEIGEPIQEEDDYFGMPVVLARRLCESAEGGQILVSDLVRRLAGSRGGYTFRGPQLLRLKNIAEPVSAYELDWQPAVEAPRMPHPLNGEVSSFVGRERELQRLEQAWERAESGQQQLVFLTGEPGIGKTRLALEFAGVTHAEGATVLYGRSDEGAAIAYQPFLEALRQYAADCSLTEPPVGLGPTAAELSERFAGGTLNGPDSAQKGDQQRLYDDFVDFLSELTYKSPAILILDDLHWAEAPALRLLKHLARKTGELPLLIIGAYRRRELGRGHPLPQALADLRRYCAFEHVPVGGLDESEVSALMSPWLQKSEPGFVHAIYQQTEGNPFFIEEVLRHLSETGALAPETSHDLTDADVLRMAIPESLKDVIGQRLSRLSEECNSILTIASVIGREFALDALERASSLPAQRLLDPLEEAAAAGMIAEVSHSAGRYSFSHTLIYETLYEELTTTRRVHLHGQTVQYADSGGAKLAYEVLGSGGPYMVALGLSNCPSVRSRVWAAGRRWDRLSRRCRVLLYDRPGVGFSAAPEEGYDLASCVGHLRALLEAVGAGRVVLWGAADGGPLAISYAASYPQSVCGLLLLGTSPKLLSAGDFPWGINSAVAESFLRLDAVDQAQATSEVIRTRQQPEEAGAIAELMARVPRPAWSRILRGMSDVDVRDLLPQIRVPTLIVHDPDNDYIPVGAAHYLHEHIPGSRLEVTEEYGASHIGDSAFQKIESFIEEVT